jgi:hypothetical protein
MKKKNKKLKQIKYPILWVYRRFINPQVVGVKNIIKIKQTTGYPWNAATVKITYLSENTICCTVYIITQKVSNLALTGGAFLRANSARARLLCHCTFKPAKQESHVHYNGVISMIPQGDVNRILNEVYKKIVLMGWGKLPDSADPSAESVIVLPPENRRSDLTGWLKTDDAKTAAQVVADILHHDLRYGIKSLLTDYIKTKEQNE